MQFIEDPLRSEQIQEVWRFSIVCINLSLIQFQIPMDDEL